MHEQLALLHSLAVLGHHERAVRNLETFKFPILGVAHAKQTSLLQHNASGVARRVGDINIVAVDKFNTSSVDGLVFTFRGGGVRNSTGVEGAHGELSTRLSNTLRRDNANGHAFFNGLAGGEIHAVAGATNSVLRFTGQWTANLEHAIFAQEIFDVAGDFWIDHLARGNDGAIVAWVDQRQKRGATTKNIAKWNFNVLTLHNGLLWNAALCAAIFLTNRHALGHIAQLAREVTGVGGLEGGVGETLAGAVG